MTHIHDDPLWFIVLTPPSNIIVTYQMTHAPAKILKTRREFGYHLIFPFQMNVWTNHCHKITVLHMSEIANFRVWRIFLQQEALGPHHSPEKHFRAIHKPEKSYEYNAYCLKNLITPPPLKTRMCSFNLTNLNSRIPITQGRFVPCFIHWMELKKWLWRFLNAYELFSLLSLLRRVHGPLFKSPLPKKALCQVWLKFARWF